MRIDPRDIADIFQRHPDWQVGTEWYETYNEEGEVCYCLLGAFVRDKVTEYVSDPVGTVWNLELSTLLPDMTDKYRMGLASGWDSYPELFPCLHHFPYAGEDSLDRDEQFILGVVDGFMSRELVEKSRTP